MLCGDVRGECCRCAGAFRLLQTAIRGVTSWSLLLRQVLRGKENGPEEVEGLRAALIKEDE